MNAQLKEWIKHNAMAAIVMLALLLIILVQQPTPIECNQCPSGTVMVCQETFDYNFNMEEIQNGIKDKDSNTQRSSNGN